MPVANTEAMASGLICIASKVGGLPEIIQPGVNGFLFDPKHPEQLKKILEDIFFGKFNIDKISTNARIETIAKFDQIKLSALKQYKIFN